MLLSQVPLEKMDWWIDLNNRRLLGNPEHGGRRMAQVFREGDVGSAGSGAVA